MTKEGQECGSPLHGAPEYQPLQTFFAQNVQPQAIATAITLSGGKTIPYYFSLGINSTVPFVKLEAAGGTQKVFSWGETVEVPPGQTVTVRNVSYMSGDIQIQSGREYAPCPPRIQKRVFFATSIVAPPPGFLRLESTTQVDCRRARRAYLIWDPNITLNADIIDITVYHLNKQHTQENNAGDVTSGVGTFMFQAIYQIPPFTTVGQLPIGFASPTLPDNSNVPHALGDFIVVELNTPTAIGEPGDLDPFYCVLEYA